MAKRFYYRPSNNVNDEVRKEYLKLNSELLEIVLFYIWHKEYDRFKKGVIKYIDKKQFGGKVVKQEYYNHINTIKNTVRKKSRNTVSEVEAKVIISILKEALNYEQVEDKALSGDELIDFIFKLTNQYIQSYKHEEGMKQLLNSREGSIIEDISKEESKINVDSYEEELYDAVRQSLLDETVKRRERISNRVSPFPNTYETTTKVFQRNPDVIAEVLIRANGICEKCGKDAPFKRKSDGTPYLEVHHINRLADGGEDTVENAIAVCPNCHRELHFG
jgi:predicted HNH restriction endonuclease